MRVYQLGVDEMTKSKDSCINVNLINPSLEAVPTLEF